ncbi:MAG: hypothetical protein ABI333_21330 [bacterium]
MRLLLVSVVVALALTGFAAPVTLARAPAAKKIDRFDFKDPEKILGWLPKPIPGWVTAVRKTQPPSLIEYRLQWKDELLKLTEDL